MKNNTILSEYISKSNQEKFEYFMSTIFMTNRTPQYWVNWGNVFKNTDDLEISLNTLNYLVGKNDITNKARKLFLSQPELLKAIPILIACRDESINILRIDDGNLDTYQINFSNPDTSRIEEYLKFMEETGLMDFLHNGLKQSLIDYVYGVQVGLDTNGRKNRSGQQNEIILDENATAICRKYDYCEYSNQATNSFIKEKWGINVPEIDNHNKKGRGGRRYDGVIYNSKTEQLTIIETNFYSGGGSKLKSVSGEFANLYNECFKNHEKINFVWITDGKGWETAKNPLRESFDIIPYIFNLNMIKNDFLEQVVIN